MQLKSVTHARSLGIDTVFQDLALVPGMTVYHNMFLNRELTHGVGPLRFDLEPGDEEACARQYLDDIGVRVPSINAEVARMSGGQRQAIAIARSTHSDAKILLLDEPLAAMGSAGGALIIELIQELRRSDVSMIVIAHNYVHVLEMSGPREPAQQRAHHARQADGRDLGRGADQHRRRRVPAAEATAAEAPRADVGRLTWLGQAGSGSRSTGWSSSSTRG